MCGGPSSQQKQAASSQAALSQEELQALQQTLPGATSFYSQEAKAGLPYFAAQSQYATSNLAQQIAQQKANLARQNAGFGGALPSGFAAQENRDLDLGGAQAFDQNMLNLLAQQEAAKRSGAAGLAAIASGSGSTAAGANQSIMNAPLQNNFWSNLISGVIQGGAQAGSAYLGR